MPFLQWDLTYKSCETMSTLFAELGLTKCSSRPPTRQLALTNAVARRRLNMALGLFLVPRSSSVNQTCARGEQL